MRLGETERDPAREREVRAPGGEGTRRAGIVREKARRAHARERTRPPAGARRSSFPALPRARAPCCPGASAPATLARSVGPPERPEAAGGWAYGALASPSLLVRVVWRPFPRHRVSGTQVGTGESARGGEKKQIGFYEGLEKYGSRSFVSLFRSPPGCLPPQGLELLPSRPLLAQPGIPGKQLRLCERGVD